MRKILAFIAGFIGLGLTAPAWGEAPTLTVYTYSSFTAEWGPGPAIKKAFEAECGCRLEWVSVEDGVTLLSRLRLEGENSKADVVLGLDTNLMAAARATGLFAPHEADLSNLSLPVTWEDDLFVPFDYGYFAFVYDKTRLENPPRSFEELIGGDPDRKIVIEDPRTSTPGLGLLLWMKKVYGDEAAAAWQRLRPRILTVTKGWSEAYGLFLKGEAPMVLSYTTSPAYHIIAEDKHQYAAASFEEGHYLQIEVAARVASSDNPELAKRFLAFVVSPEFQSAIPTGNWMYPVIELEGGLPPAFDTLVTPKKALLFPPDVVAAHRDAWIAEWLAAMSQ